MFLIAALVSYANVFGNPFLLDDDDGVVGNPYIRSLWPLSETFRAPLQSVVAGRPVVSLTLALNYAWGGLSPAGYHAVNLVILWLGAVVLFALLRRALRLPSIPPALQSGASAIAVAASALWLLHPLQTEVVDYVVQRTESLMGLFYLTTLYAALRAMTSPGDRRWIVLAIVACGLGMATKESMATAPVAVIIFDAVFVAGSIQRALAERRSLYAGLAFTWLVLAGLVASGPRFRSAGFSSGVSTWTYLLNQGPIILQYFKRAFWPHPLIADYGPTLPIAIQQAAPAVAVVGALLVATVVLCVKRPRLAFPALFVFLTLAPASSLIPIATEVGAERRMHLPLAGLIVFVVVAVASRVLRSDAPRGSRRAAGIGVVVICLAFMATTYARNREYADPVGLWTAVIEHWPSGRAHYSLGFALKAQGRQAEALAEYEKSAALGHAEAHYAIAFDMYAAGRVDEAIQSYQRFLAEAPDDYRAPQAAILLGRALARRGRLQEAEQSYRQALSMAPRNTDALGGLADVLLDARRYAEAVDAYRAYVAAVPDNAAAYGNLGRALLLLDRDGEAVEAFARAATLAPSDPGVRLNYGMSLVSAGRVDEAVTQYRAGIEAAPNDVRLLGAMGVALAMKGAGQEAIEFFSRGFRLDPSNPQLRDDFRTVFGVEPRIPAR